MTITLSVVPVRLDYACGHAALASLARVKGERPSQRNARVNHEKASAALRPCDFCEPASQLVVGTSDREGVSVAVAAAHAGTAATVDGMLHDVHPGPGEDGVTHDLARDRKDGAGDHQQEELMTTTTSVPATGPDQAAATPPSARPKRVFPVRKLNDEQERELTRLYAETPTRLGQIGQRFGIALTSVVRIALRNGAPLRSPTVSRASAADRPGSAALATGPVIESESKPVQPEPSDQPAPAPAPTVRGPRSITRRRRAAPAGGARSTELRRFVVTFAAEQVLEARSVLDALQEARARGATEVTSIVRIA
jgi:hypothetical protein